jgi:hypothetical protein
MASKEIVHALQMNSNILTGIKEIGMRISNNGRAAKMGIMIEMVADGARVKIMTTKETGFGMTGQDEVARTELVVMKAEIVKTGDGERARIGVMDDQVTETIAMIAIARALQIIDKA